MISFSLGWSDAAGGAFETIWFQHCFRRVSSRRAKPKPEHFALVLISRGLLPGQLAAPGAAEDGHRPLRWTHRVDEGHGYVANSTHRPRPDLL